MKHAVILAHPDPDSLNASIAAAYAKAVRDFGGDVIVRDLYAIGFDPCLKAEEIPGPGVPVFRDDVARERAMLADIDVFAFVYPLWFNAAPAILKGYVDRVFSMGFGFKPGFEGSEPALNGRQLISFTTSGAPDHWVRDTGALSALMSLFDSHLSAMCGLTLVDHVHFGGMVTGLPAETYEDVMARVKRTAAANFAPIEPATDS